ncbi:MAG: BlaI/MecI/CopY family transcriptional regulator [Cytophagaceae bacterium]|nr:MAG: BlaI/MecI/CopY family transcriptional regulator [Cytophagaceae bacterium]
MRKSKSVPDTSSLSRRERQLMELIYAAGQGTAADLQAAMTEAPSYSTVRTLLRILEEKGHLTHQQDGQRYVYLPVQPRQQAARSSLRQVLNTFFGGSVEQAVATLVEAQDTKISPEELDRLSALIERARQKGDEHE